jgi:Bacterial SH3 domain
LPVVPPPLFPLRAGTALLLGLAAASGIGTVLGQSALQRPRAGPPLQPAPQSQDGFVAMRPRVPLDPEVVPTILPSAGIAGALADSAVPQEEPGLETSAARDPANSVQDADSSVPEAEPAAAEADLDEAESAEAVAPAPPAPQWLVAAAGVRLRAEPSTTSPVLATLSSGTRVTGVPVSATEGPTGWVQVQWRDRLGWIAANLLRAAP